jgi:hypothetical protein
MKQTPIMKKLEGLQREHAAKFPHGHNPWTSVMQGIDTAVYYMQAAEQKIDAHFGQGYAKNHPELIGHFMQTAVTDTTNNMLDLIGDQLTAINDEGGTLATELDAICGELKKMVPEEVSK